MKKRFILLVSAVIMSVSFCTGCTFGNTVETAEDDQKVAEVVETAMEASSEPDVVTPYDEWTDEEVITRAIDDFYADYPELFEATLNINEEGVTCNFTNVEEIKEAALETYRNGGFPIEVKMYTSEAGSQSNSILSKQIYPEPNGDGNWSLYYPDWYAQYGAGTFSSIQMFGRNDPKIMFSIYWGYTGEVNDNGYHLFRLSDFCYYRPSFYGESSVGAKTLEAEAERLNNEE